MEKDDGNGNDCFSFLKVRSNKADIDHMKTSPTLVSKTLVYTEHQVSTR